MRSMLAVGTAEAGTGAPPGLQRAAARQAAAGSAGPGRHGDGDRLTQATSALPCWQHGLTHGRSGRLSATAIPAVIRNCDSFPECPALTQALAGTSPLNDYERLAGMRGSNEHNGGGR